MNTLIAQCKSELIRTIRNRRFIIFTVIFPVMFYFILINQVGGDTIIEGVSWNLKLMIGCATIGVMGSGLNTLSNRISLDFSQGWIKLIKVSPLPPFTYVIANMIAQLFLNFLIICIVFMVAFFYQGINLSITEWLIICLWLWVTSIVSILGGIIIGVLVPSDSAQVIGTGIFMLLLFLGGVAQPPGLLPDFMQIISKVLPVYYIVKVPTDVVAHHGIEALDYIVILAYTVVFIFLSVFAINKKQLSR
ncbi:ABC transporter permease [Bacillus thuringiensis]|uniref:ABC transporter permease n=1 Tax=Bacillus cereus group TaxID=86661 RepID=UPI002E1F6792|nr:ABC transporter permease [Bacillus thuringiensis]